MQNTLSEAAEICWIEKYTYLQKYSTIIINFCLFLKPKVSSKSCEILIHNWPPNLTYFGDYFSNNYWSLMFGVLATELVVITRCVTRWQVVVTPAAVSHNPDLAANPISNSVFIDSRCYGGACFPQTCLVWTYWLSPEPLGSAFVSPQRLYCTVFSGVLRLPRDSPRVK